MHTGETSWRNGTERKRLWFFRKKPENLPKGFPFPFRLGEQGLTPISGEEKIRQSIYIILMTRQGERPLRPEFGSRIWEYVFELPGETVRHLLCTEIVQAIDQWEHRVQNVQAHIDDSAISEGKILIEVSYTIRATNRPDNLVFPFYLEEP